MLIPVASVAVTLDGKGVKPVSVKNSVYTYSLDITGKLHNLAVSVR